MQKIVGGSSPWHPPVFNLIYVWSLDDSMKGARLCGQFDVHPFHLRAFQPRTTIVPSFAIPVSFLHLLLFPPPPPPATCAIFLLNDEYKLVFLLYANFIPWNNRNIIYYSQFLVIIYLKCKLHLDFTFLDR